MAILRTTAELEQARFFVASCRTDSLRRLLADPMRDTADEILNQNKREFRALILDEIERREKARRDV